MGGQVADLDLPGHMPGERDARDPNPASTHGGAWNGTASRRGPVRTVRQRFDPVLVPHESQVFHGAKTGAFHKTSPIIPKFANAPVIAYLNLVIKVWLLDKRWEAVTRIVASHQQLGGTGNRGESGGTSAPPYCAASRQPHLVLHR